MQGAAEPWSPATHELFPEGARARARQLLFPLFRLGDDARLVGAPPPSVFVHAVLAHAITRESRPSDPDPCRLSAPPDR